VKWFPSFNFLFQPIERLMPIYPFFPYSLHVFFVFIQIISFFCVIFLDIGNKSIYFRTVLKKNVRKQRELFSPKVDSSIPFDRLSEREFDYYS